MGCAGSSLLWWGLSLVVASSGVGGRLFFPVVHGLLIEVASLLPSTGSRVLGLIGHELQALKLGLSYPSARGIFLDQGSKLGPLCALHCQLDSYPPRHQTSPGSFFFITGKCLNSSICFSWIFKVWPLVYISELLSSQALLS